MSDSASYYTPDEAVKAKACRALGGCTLHGFPDAPEQPPAPATAPDSTPSVSHDPGTADEALKERLAEASYVIAHPDGDPWAELLPRWQGFGLKKVDAALLPLVVAYGDQRAEEALRDASQQCVDLAPVKPAYRQTDIALAYDEGRRSEA